VLLELRVKQADVVARYDLNGKNSPFLSLNETKLFLSALSLECINRGFHRPWNYGGGESYDEMHLD
jgi:hypothetical protein